MGGAHGAAPAQCRRESFFLKQPQHLLPKIKNRPDFNACHFSERVRDLFNDRAKIWGRNYQPLGKLTWRLDQFCSVLGDVTSPGAKVLDFGCGSGHLAAHLRTCRYTLTACDMADQMIVSARQKFGDADIKWVSLPADWRRLPFADQSFDAVVASSVLEYVGDLELVFSETARVLRRGGALIFNVPNPKNGRRKRENWANRVTEPTWIRRAVCTIPRIQRYLNYLGLSKNRFPLAEWETGATRHGFRRLPHSRQLPVNRPLFLFAFQKECIREVALQNGDKYPVAVI